MGFFVKYPVVFLAGFLSVCLFTPIVQRLALRLNVVDEPGGRRIHAGRIPRLGGIAVFCAFHTACAVLFLLPWEPFRAGLDITWWFSFLIFSSCVLALGIIDDVFGLCAPLKLAGQALIVALAFMYGVRVGSIVGIDIPLWLDFLLTQVWCLGLMNAFNLIDGMDGLAAGLACIGALGIAGHQFLLRVPGDALVLLGLIGACLGFLRYNFHPASIFLGDSGSMFLGFAIAVISLGVGAKGATAASLGVPLLAAGVPLFDAILALWRRSARRFMPGESAGQTGGIMDADKDHLHHRLLRLGISQRRVAVLLYGLSMLLVLIALSAAAFGRRGIGVYLVAFVLCAYIVFRHLAWIELWDTGAAIIRGLERPSGRAIGLVVYPVADLCVLVTMLAFSVYMTSYGTVDIEGFRTQWVSDAGYAIGFPILFLILVRAYSRVWSLARISEYALVGSAVIAGIFVGYGLAMMFNGTPPFAGLLRALLFAGLAVPGVVGSRAFLRVIHDLMQWLRRFEGYHDREIRKALLCGVDFRCTLFIREHGYRFVDEGVGHAVVGLVDDNMALRKRYVHGYRVLGTIAEFPRIIKRYNIDEIICVGTLTDEQVERICHAGSKAGVKVLQWTTRLRHPMADK